MTGNPEPAGNKTAGRRKPLPGNLGRGLSALFAEHAAAGNDSARVRMLPLFQLVPGRLQPRRRFDDSGLAALAESIRSQGILQPLLVRQLPLLPLEAAGGQENAISPSPQAAGAGSPGAGNLGEGAGIRYEIIAGERRWRAARLAGLADVPVLVRSLDDRDTLQVALIENIQRQDLGAMEEAEAYQRLIVEFDYTQEALAQVIGKSRSHVANMLRLLGLPCEVRQLVEDGRLSAGHARALLGLADASRLASEVVARGMSVRAVERLAQMARDRQPHAPDPHAPGPHAPEAAGTAASPRPAPGLPHASGTAGRLQALAQDVSRLLGLKTLIEPRGKGGFLTIRYDSEEELDSLLQRFAARPAPRQGRYGKPRP